MTGFKGGMNKQTECVKQGGDEAALYDNGVIQSADPDFGASSGAVNAASPRSMPGTS